MEGGPRMGVALSLCWTKKKVPLEREEGGRYGGEVWEGRVERGVKWIPKNLDTPREIHCVTI